MTDVATSEVDLAFPSRALGCAHRRAWCGEGQLEIDDLILSAAGGTPAPSRRGGASSFVDAHDREDARGFEGIGRIL